MKILNFNCIKNNCIIIYAEHNIQNNFSLKITGLLENIFKIIFLLDYNVKELICTYIRLGKSFNLITTGI